LRIAPGPSRAWPPSGCRVVVGTPSARRASPAIPTIEFALSAVPTTAIGRVNLGLARWRSPHRWRVKCVIRVLIRTSHTGKVQSGVAGSTAGLPATPWRSALTRTVPADPAQSVCCSRIASGLDFRRSDEGDGARGNRQHGDRDEDCALSLIRSASGRPPLSLSWTTGGEWAGLRKRLQQGAAGHGGKPRGSLPRIDGHPGAAHQRRVGHVKWC
jgi:hypothetical protein